MKEWNIVHDCDDENEKPTCWSIEISNKDYGKYAWITENSDGFDIEVERRDEICSVKKCRTLTSAKRWVTENLL